MAKTTTSVKEFRKNSEAGAISARPIGGRVLLPGIYNFDADPSLRYEERDIQGSTRTYLQVEVKSDHGWVDLAQLMKRTKVRQDSASLDYVNEWIQQYSDVAELAAALAGNTLNVSSNRVDTYSTYQDGQTVPARVVGSTYKATLIINESPKYKEPREEAPKAEE